MTDFPPPTPQEIEELRSRLDELCRASDPKAIRAFLEYQEHHTRYVSAKYGRWMCQVEMYLSLLLEVADGLNYVTRTKWPLHRNLQFVIATHALKQLCSAYTLLYQGNYENAILLLRSVYESFLRIVFISCHPDHPYNAYGAEGQEGPRFNATALVKDQLQLPWLKYSVMSAIAHSNKWQVMQDVIAISKGEIRPITVTYKIDENLMSVAMNYFDFLMSIWLRLYSSVFRPDIGDNETIVQRYRLIDDYAEMAFDNLSRHSKSEYWRRVAADLGRIFALITHMDEHPTDDWKTVWGKLN